MIEAQRRFGLRQQSADEIRDLHAIEEASAADKHGPMW
jgi:hypothetical protein